MSINCSYHQSGVCRSCQFNQVVSFEAKSSRYKAKLSAFLDDELNLFFGIPNMEGDQVSFIELEHCPLHFTPINLLIEEVKKLINDFNISIYNPKLKSGELKNIIITVGYQTNEMMLRLVARSDSSIKKFQKIADLLTMQNLNLNLKVVTLNIQEKPAAILEGVREIYLTKKQFIESQLGEIKLFYYPQSFMQVTPVIAEQLYSMAASWVPENSCVLDLYCGSGAFSFFIAKRKKMKSIIGIEITEDAIRSAKMTYQLYFKDEKMDFVVADVSSYLQNFNEKIDTILVNPPRRGLDIKSMDIMINSSAEAIIYSSCHAKTLLENIKYMEKNFKIINKIEFDMFPYSAQEHKETLVLLKRIKE